MTKFTLASGQSSAYFAQRLGMSHLAKEHGDELTPTTEIGRAVPRCASGRQSRTPGGGSIAESVRKCSQLESRLSLLSFVIGFSRAQPQASRCSALFSFTNRIVIWTSVTHDIVQEKPSHSRSTRHTE